ncbi:RNA-splicing factor, partial [Neurospora sp. IMI 360204]
MADTEQPPAAPEPTTATATAPIAPVAIFKKRGAKGKANLRKRPASPPPAAKDSDDDSSDFESSEDEATGQRIKRRKKNHKAAVMASSRDNNGKGMTREEQIRSNTIYEADRDAALRLDATKQDATKGSNWFDEDKEKEDLSVGNLLGRTRTMKNKKSGGEGDDTQTSEREPDGTYRGLANQASYIQKNPNAPNRKVGPIKAPSNIRTITITDMAPDVCKDYKQTGFCGFGDNCKFLHAREDYAHGWQLDKEWENVTKGKKNLQGTIVASADRKKKNEKDAADEDAEAAEEALLENIPFACIICRGPYSNSPVVTRCGHYFCEGCALKRYRKDPSCAACGAGTNGVFNAAKRLAKLLEKKRARAERLRREARERGEE